MNLKFNSYFKFSRDLTDPNQYKLGKTVSKNFAKLEKHSNLLYQTKKKHVY